MPRPHIVLRLRTGWSYDPRARCFRKEGAEPFRPAADLPKHARIALQVPALAGKRDRTPDEDALARGLQLVPPAGTRLPALLERVAAWPCVETAWIAPEPSAPAR